MNSKFRGSLLGVLIGDCSGAIFEGAAFDAGAQLVLKNFFNKLDGEFFKAPQHKFTDDTAMTKSVARCLIKFDPETYQKNLAVNFVKEFFDSPLRGYGPVVIDLFHQLKYSKFENFLKPAKDQFNGQGSFGNGAAMRISPVGLYCHNKSEDFLIDLVRKTSVITHSNAIGVNGAILQALAVHKNLKLDPKETIDVNKYVDELLENFKKIETGEDEHGLREEKYFTKQLESVKKLLNKDPPPSEEEIVNVLGHSVNALFSVPTALYAFLRSTRSTDYPSKPIRRTAEYTIALGGDTDTIASMACALAGSFYGDSEFVGSNLIKHMEGNEEVVELADQLFKASSEA